MGECPSWFRVVQAARYLRVAPWDLADQPLYWLEVAEASQSAEQYAADLHARRQPGA
jgi:hypothetical protein